MIKRVWNLQIFADDDGGADGANVDGAKDVADKTEQPTDPFEAFLKDPKNQAEFDRRVNKAIQTREANLSEQHKQAIEQAKKEAEEVASMTAEQQIQHELDKLKEENEKLQAAQLRVELSKTASGLLRDEKIDVTDDVLDFVLGADEKSTKANIEKLTGVIQEQLKAAEARRATGTTPTVFKGTNQQKTDLQRRLEKYK